MNIRILVSVYMLACVALASCTPATATQAVPSTARLTDISPNNAATAAPSMDATVAPATAIPSTHINYTTHGFKLPMTVKVSSACEIVDDSLSIWSVECDSWGPGAGMGINIVTDASVTDPLNGQSLPFPSDFAAWLKDDPDFKDVSSEAVTVAGLPALQVDAAPIHARKSFIILKTSAWNTLQTDGEWRFILIEDVKGERVLINLIAPNGKPLSALPQQEVQGFLESITFQP